MVLDSSLHEDLGDILRVEGGHDCILTDFWKLFLFYPDGQFEKEILSSVFINIEDQYGYRP